MKDVEWEVQCGVKGQPPRALICPTFSDADQLMYSTVTLATWKDNAVSMSHTVMEGTKHHGYTLKYVDTFRQIPRKGQEQDRYKTLT